MRSRVSRHLIFVVLVGCLTTLPIEKGFAQTSDTKIYPFGKPFPWRTASTPIPVQFENGTRLRVPANYFATTIPKAGTSVRALLLYALFPEWQPRTKENEAFFSGSGTPDARSRMRRDRVNILIIPSKHALFQKGTLFPRNMIEEARQKPNKSDLTVFGLARISQRVLPLGKGKVFHDDDLYFLEGDGAIKTYLLCSPDSWFEPEKQRLYNEGRLKPMCNQYFAMNEWKLQVQLGYFKTDYLPRWQEMEGSARALISTFRVD